MKFNWQKTKWTWIIARWKIIRPSPSATCHANAAHFMSNNSCALHVNQMLHTPYQANAAHIMGTWCINREHISHIFCALPKSLNWRQHTRLISLIRYLIIPDIRDDALTCLGTRMGTRTCRISRKTWPEGHKWNNKIRWPDLVKL